MRIHGEKLKVCMANACMNPKELSEKAGICYPALKRAMQGKNSKFSTIGKIARALGVDVTEIIEQEE